MWSWMIEEIEGIETLTGHHMRNHCPKVSTRLDCLNRSPNPTL
jgi:hypothetical protein